MSDRESASPPREAPNSTSPWMSRALGTPARDLTGLTLGDFEVERLLGRGGMGEVYLARQVSLNRRVAFKVLRPDLLSNPTYLGRFEAEAWAAAKLNHPNIVHIYHLGATDGVRYIAMEYVEGRNLRDYLSKKGTIDLPLALSIMRQTGVAVGAAGDLGLIHRDIKPENLLLTKKGQVKVADFGLCRDTGDTTHNLTQDGVAMGTPSYMSPEQVQGKALDHRSDLYSMGVSFYHMLAGEAPFRGDSAFAVALKHVREMPVDLSVHRPDLPPDLCRMVMKLMEKAPQARYQAASEMLRDLAKIREAVMASSATAAVAPASLEFSAVAAAKPPTPARGTPVDWGAFRPGRRAFAAAVAVGAAAGGALGWMSRPPDLLAAGAPEPKGPPIVWLDPAWKDVERLAGAEAQYHHAQSRAAPDDREAAFLAVLGRFPSVHPWDIQACTQLARIYLHRRDGDKLKALGEELARNKRGEYQLLAAVVSGGSAALEDDDDAMRPILKKALVDLHDVGVLELGAEVADFASQASRAQGRPQTDTDMAAGVRQDYLRKLIQVQVRDSRTP